MSATMGVTRAGVSFAEALEFQMLSTAKSAANARRIAMDVQRL